MSKTFFIFRRQQNIVFLDFEIVAMRFCNNCVRLKKTCQIDENSEKCIECIQLNWICNLAFLNVIKYRRLNVEKKTVWTILRYLTEKQSRFSKHLDQIKKKHSRITIKWCFFRNFWSFYRCIIWTNRVEWFDC